MTQFQRATYKGPGVPFDDIEVGKFYVLREDTLTHRGKKYNPMLNRHNDTAIHKPSSNYFFVKVVEKTDDSLKYTFKQIFQENPFETKEENSWKGYQLSRITDMSYKNLIDKDKFIGYFDGHSFYNRHTFYKFNEEPSTIFESTEKSNAASNENIKNVSNRLKRSAEWRRGPLLKKYYGLVNTARIAAESAVKNNTTRKGGKRTQKKRNTRRH